MAVKLKLSGHTALNIRDIKTKPTNFLETAVALQTTGHSCNEHVMILMKEVLGGISASKNQAENKRLHHLFYYFVSNLRKKEGDKILAEVLLLVNQIRKDVLSVNCYTRIRAMRCVTSFLGIQPLVDNFYSAIKENVTHPNFLVRRCAVNLACGFFCSDPTKYADALSISEKRLLAEENPLVTREILRGLYSMTSILVSGGSSPLSAPPHIKLTKDISNTRGYVGRNEKKDRENVHSTNQEYNRILKDYIQRTSSIPIPVLEYIVDTTDNLQFVAQNIQIVTFHAGLRILEEIASQSQYNSLPPYTPSKNDINRKTRDQIGKLAPLAMNKNEQRTAISDIDASLVVTALLESNRKTDAVIEILNQRYPAYVISGNLTHFLEITKESHLFTSVDTFNYIFSAAESSEDYSLIGDFLNALLENTDDIENKVQVLKAIHQFYAKCAHISDKSLESLKLLLNSEIPAISFEALNIISSLQIENHCPADVNNPTIHRDMTQIIDFTKIKYGKIFRKALTLVADRIAAESEVLSFVNLFERSLRYDRNTQTFLNEGKNMHPKPNSCAKTAPESSDGDEKRPILASLDCKSTPFIGNAVALFFEQIHTNVYLSRSTVGRIIALLLLFIKHGKIYNKIDMSSESIVNFCIQSISDLYSLRKEARNTTQSHDMSNSFNAVPPYQTFSELKTLDSLLATTTTPNLSGPTGYVADPIEFFFGAVKAVKKPSETSIPQQKDTMQQLSSVSDPIFIESRVTITGYEAKINLVMLNRAKSALQNISLDLTASQNLTLETLISFNTLQPGEMRTAVVRAKINECSDAFVAGNLSFVFLKNKQYTGKYSINLVPIKLYIRDFLVSNNYSNEFFLEAWPKLEWENTYTIKIHPTKIKLCDESQNLSTIIQKICHVLKSSLVDSIIAEKYAVCNMACKTTLGNTILLNFILTNEELLNIEARIRSDSEDVVKSISKILSSIIKK